MDEHICKQCGSCCKIHWRSFEATHDDVIRWKRERRSDILKYLVITSKDPNNLSGAFISDSCPFLRRSEKDNFYYCIINDTKPFYCKNYPNDGICEYTPY